MSTMRKSKKGMDTTMMIIVTAIIAIIVLFVSTTAFGGSFGKSMKSIFGLQKGVDDCDDDGVSNYLDDCPYTPGDSAYNGCTFKDFSNKELTAAQKKKLCNVKLKEECECKECGCPV